MAEYIEREAALSVINRLKSPTRSPAQNELIRTAQVGIDRIRAADVAPVRHGRWVHDYYENCSEQFEIVKCTNCGHKAYAMAIYVRGGNYCPNCGAKMDLEGGES